MVRLSLCASTLLLAAASYALPAAEPARPHVPAPSGLAFAQASCGSCHAVGRVGSSRHSSAPPFAVIVNQEGLTAQTLALWLKGAHNYPREMDFALKQHEVDTLVSYMITLRDPNYRRSPDW